MGEPITAPACERAGLNGGAGIAHQRDKEMYIVEAQEAESEDFLSHEQVSDLSLIHI